MEKKMMMLMNSSCSGAGCIDAQTPIHVNAGKLQRWAQSDKEFLRMLSMDSSNSDSNCSSPYLPPRSPFLPCPPRFSTSSRLDDESYACRERYLKSYTFSVKDNKESAAQRTKKWLKDKQKLKHKKKKNNVSGNSKGGDESAAANKSAAAGSGRRQRPCSFIEAILMFFFVCEAKVDVVNE